MARITIGGTAVIPQGATASGPIEAQERPLAWLSLPPDWPVDTPVTLQGALTAEAPDAGSADWRDVTNMIGQPIAFLGQAGQIMALQEGVSLGLPFLRLRIGTAAAAARSIPYGVRWLAQ